VAETQGCPWCNALPERHPDMLSRKQYMIVRHKQDCYRSPQIGGYELLDMNKLERWNTRTPSPDVQQRARRAIQRWVADLDYGKLPPGQLTRLADIIAAEFGGRVK